MKLVEIMSTEDKAASKWLHKYVDGMSVNGYSATKKLTFKDGHVDIKLLKTGPHSAQAGDLEYNDISLYGYADFDPPFDAPKAFEKFSHMKVLRMNFKDATLLPNIKSIYLKLCNFESFKGIDKLTNLKHLELGDINSVDTNKPCGLLSLYKYALKHEDVLELDWNSFKIKGNGFDNQPIKIFKDSLKAKLSTLEFQDKLIDADFDDWAKL